MAAFLRCPCPTFRAPTPAVSVISSKSVKISSSVSFSKRSAGANCLNFLHFDDKLMHRRSVGKFVTLASSGEATETEEAQEFEVQDNVQGAIEGEAGEDRPSDDIKADVDEPIISPIISSLLLYKEAIQNNEESKIAEVEVLLKSIEDEKNELEKRVALLSEELLMEKDRILRISADFDNFRKRTERERLSLVTNAQGEVVENLLPVLDNFERAKAQIKIETEGEEKISSSYQSIYKQFVEILTSIRVMPVETVGKPFDPLMHEAIMREESTEFEEGIIIEEYRRGFKLGDRLLRPSMVKVSAGPGRAKPETPEPSISSENASENGVDNGGEAGSKDRTIPSD
ncbi:hypothetical protein Nepgr_028541 [Nepenthes gracilis]|uniref:GrpE protein homolog n=1 Tax=Nepenthes gracilis TaxID=150966 RepID=A0AAD3Y2I1_NEPGR|nr:hypothetical protein Nepgr_028541 [Nepenthes gracilis]